MSLANFKKDLTKLFKEASNKGLLDRAKNLSIGSHYDKAKEPKKIHVKEVIENLGLHSFKVDQYYGKNGNSESRYVVSPKGDTVSLRFTHNDRAASKTTAVESKITLEKIEQKDERMGIVYEIKKLVLNGKEINTSDHEASKKAFQDIATQYKSLLNEHNALPSVKNAKMGKAIAPIPTRININKT